MALLVSNTTADIYRTGNSPPAAPDVPAVPIFLAQDYENAHRANVGSGTNGRWTHTALVDPDTDVRDSYGGGAIGQDGWSSTWDTLYVADQNGVAYFVVFVGREGQGTAGDVLRIYLQRQAVTWPNNNL